MVAVQVSSNQKYRIAALITLVVIVGYWTIPALHYKNNVIDINVNQEYLQNPKKLIYTKGKFYLNGAQLRILSGSLHYFRVLPEYWQDRLLKLRAMGLNTVTTYVPWNKHEEIKGNFNFEGILNLRLFIKTAQNLGLYVILRPSPYICAEWEFGGMPSWLLRDPNMQVRSMYFGFTKAVDEYYKQLMHEISDLQYQHKGPIIAFQIENEYGSYGDNKHYLHFLKHTMQKYGIIEQLFISDSFDGSPNTPSIPGVFIGVNSNNLNQIRQMTLKFRSLDENNPPFVTELWSGWFLRWGSKSTNDVISPQQLIGLVSTLLDDGFNMNFYMFHGGTNFEFMNGNNPPDPLITSYDYFAPLSENGDVTELYHKLRSTILKTLSDSEKSKVPDVPRNIPSYNYGQLSLYDCLTWEHLLDLIEKPIMADMPLLMEMLPINEQAGQAYGFLLYRAEFRNGQRVRIVGKVRDRALILVNGNVLDPEKLSVGIIDSTVKNPTFDLKHATLIKTANAERIDNTLDILVENLGRVNFVQRETNTFDNENTFNKMRKGLYGKVQVDEEVLKSWRMYPLEFRKSFLRLASMNDKWSKSACSNVTALSPALYRFQLNVNGSPMDTWINMQKWSKGVVFCNGFNLGRYWTERGPQHTLYLPAPLLHSGSNEILIFELHKAHDQLDLVAQPIYLFADHKPKL